MKLKDLKETDGVYVGLRPTGASIHLLHDWIMKQGIPNPVAAHATHVTVLFSRAPVQVEADRAREYHGHGIRFEKVRHHFDKTDALVLVLETPSIVARHRELVALGGSHDYDDFMPHVTLTTNVEDFDWKELEIPGFGLTFANEYVRPLRTHQDSEI